MVKEQTEQNAAYYRWKLQLVIPLFQEARDALCALSLAQIKLHNIRGDLAKRMDYAGTANEQAYLEAVAYTGTPSPPPTQSAQGALAQPIAASEVGTQERGNG